MSQHSIIERLRGKFGDAIGAWREMAEGSEYQRRMGSYLEILAPQSLLDICFFLRDESELQFDSLLLISSVDNADSTLSVVYHIESTILGNHLAFKVTLPADDAHLPSVTSVWAHANWHEREAWDMMGVHFDGHPDHRRILLDEDWPGHPLRKDFKEPAFYHGMKVPY